MANKIISVFLITLLAGCSTIVNITTTPSKAKVFINDEYIGDSPVSREYSNYVGNSYIIRIEKEGYTPIRRELEKELKPAPFIIGLCLTWIPLLWCYGPKANFNYNLEADTSSSFFINSRKDLLVKLDGKVLEYGTYSVNPGKHIISISKGNITLPDYELSLYEQNSYVLN